VPEVGEGVLIVVPRGRRDTPTLFLPPSPQSFFRLRAGDNVPLAELFPRETLREVGVRELVGRVGLLIRGDKP
jgi:hypothetical protein